MKRPFSRRGDPDLDKIIRSALIKLSDDLKTRLNDTKHLTIQEMKNLTAVIKSLAEIRALLPAKQSKASAKQSLSDITADITDDKQE